MMKIAIAILFLQSIASVGADDFEGVYVREKLNEYDAFKPKFLVIIEVIDGRYMILHANPYSKEYGGNYDISEVEVDGYQGKYYSGVFDTTWLFETRDNWESIILKEEVDLSGEVPAAVYTRFGEEHVEAYDDLVKRIEASR